MASSSVRFHALALWVGLLAVSLAAGVAAAQTAEDQNFSDFGELDINQLLNMQVTSSTKVAQSVMDSPNAVWVITAEDIKRAGYRTIPEALKLAPGVYVAQLSNASWVVAMGGFPHGHYTNNILVMVDGVSVYSALDGGVQWENLPVTIDEVERIEVVRGPGGVLYGANAVNGVINIITYQPTSGSAGYVIARGGTQGVMTASAAENYISDDGKFGTRVAMAYDVDDGLGYQNGAAEFGGQQNLNASSKSRVAVGDNTNLLFEANFERALLDYQMLRAYPDVSRRTDRTILRARIDQNAGGGNWYLQAYSNNFIRQVQEAGMWEPFDEVLVQDLEFQQMIPFELAGKHKFIYGGGYRWVDIVPPMTMPAAKEKYNIANGYLHDEWSLTEQLKLNAGVKWEQNSLSSPTWQWRGALIYRPVENHSFRIGASNAYRSPSIAEMYYYEEMVPLPVVPGMLPPPGWVGPWVYATISGVGQIESEEVQSYEIGYRGVFAEKVMIDITYAYREYDDLISVIKTDPGVFVPAPIGMNVGQGYEFDNQGSAHSNSLELGLDARINEQWRVLANYSYLDLQTNEISAENRDSNVPKNIGRVQLSYSSPKGFMADASGTYTDIVKVVYVNDPSIVHHIDAYWRLDLRIAQRFSGKNGDVTVGVVGSNLGQEWRTDYGNFAGQEPMDPLRRAYYGFIEFSGK